MSAASLRSSLVHAPFPEALLKVLHVCLIMFLVDQIKIEYLRNNIYIYFIWLIRVDGGDLPDHAEKREGTEPLRPLAVTSVPVPRRATE